MANLITDSPPRSEVRKPAVVPILMLLQTRGRMSATALAPRIRGVRPHHPSRHRSVERRRCPRLCRPRAQWRLSTLMDGYRTKLTGMTQPEAEALFLAGLPGPAAELGLADALAAARLKLLAALPPNVQPRPSASRCAFISIPGRFTRRSAAVVADRGASGLERTHAEPSLCGESVYARASSRPSASCWKGASGIRGADRQGDPHLSRGTDPRPEIPDEAFPRPKNFDLATHWQKSARDYERGVYKGEAQVRACTEGHGLARTAGSYARDAARETAKPDRDGWVRRPPPIESVTHGVHELIRLREEVEVSGAARIAQGDGRYARVHDAPSQRQVITSAATCRRARCRACRSR